MGLRRISCSKHLVRASKFIIGQFHIAASRNNSTFNIQNSTLRSAPPCAKEYSCHSLYYLPTVSGPTANLVFKTSRESIDIHHWSIPHCGQPQQFNIQHSKLNIALRASVCQINSCYPRYYLPTVSGPTANLVFKTSRESIEIHHWSIPHCGQPQQFNIQHSKLNIALRASVCKKIFVTFALFVFKITRVQNPLREICVQ